MKIQLPNTNGKLATASNVKIFDDKGEPLDMSDVMRIVVDIQPNEVVTATVTHILTGINDAE